MKVTKPSRSLDNPKFKYVPACKTNLAETFKKARRLIKLQEAKQCAQQS